MLNAEQKASASHQAAHKVDWDLVAEFMDAFTSQIVSSQASADRLKLAIGNKQHHCSIRTLGDGRISVRKGGRKW